MPSMLFGMMRDGVTTDENVGRTTVDVVNKDTPPAEMDAPPDFNEVETDDNPNLGFVNRQLAGDWHESEQYSPSWGPAVDGNHNHNDIIDRQVSSSGTAAQREMAGQFGHGTAAHSVAIEPVIRDGAAFGNTYFMSNEQPAQPTMDPSMSIPPGADSDTRGAVMAAGKLQTRDAAVASQYAAFYRSTVG